MSGFEYSPAGGIGAVSADRPCITYADTIGPATHAQPAICAIILNWNSTEDTLACLGSLGCSEAVNMHPVIVDNHSGDDSVERIRAAAPEVPLIVSNENLGYAGGNNLGLRYAREHHAAYALLLNPDTRMAPDTVARLIELAEASPTIGALCPLIFSMDDPPAGVFAGGIIDWRGGRVRQACTVRGDGFLAFQWAMGCCLLLRMSALEVVGDFDSSFFLYFEETDLCRRLAYAGYQVGVTTSARAQHGGFGTIGKGSPRFEYYFTRSQIQFFVRHASKHGASPVRLLWTFYRRYLLSRQALHGIRIGDPPARARACACLDYTLGRLGRNARYSPG